MKKCNDLGTCYGLKDAWKEQTEGRRKKIQELRKLGAVEVVITESLIHSGCSLSHSAMRLWLTLKWYARGGVLCRVSIKALAKDLGCTPSTIYTILTELKKVGLVKREKNRIFILFENIRKTSYLHDV